MPIDKKYRILAVNPCNGHIHTEKDAVLFNASDKALLAALDAYSSECRRLGCGEEHLESISLLYARIAEYQKKSSKIPDTDTPCEIDRCIGGKT